MTVFNVSLHAIRKVNALSRRQKISPYGNAISLCLQKYETRFLTLSLSQRTMGKEAVETGSVNMAYLMQTAMFMLAAMDTR